MENILTWVVIALIYFLKVDAQSDRICLASMPTMAYVSSCPKNEKDFRKAEERKSCASVKQNCTSVSKFRYHCVTNEYGNSTLEVCAPIWYISGFCTEFNAKGKLIQDHYAMDCTTFEQNPCPPRYLSTDSYKYSECFKNSITKQLPLESDIYLDDQSNIFTVVDILLGILVSIQILVCIGLVSEKKWRYKWDNFLKGGKIPYCTSGTASPKRSYLSLLKGKSEKEKKTNEHEDPVGDRSGVQSQGSYTNDAENRNEMEEKLIGDAENDMCGHLQDEQEVISVAESSESPPQIVHEDTHEEKGNNETHIYKNTYMKEKIDYFEKKNIPFTGGLNPQAADELYEDVKTNNGRN